MHFEYVMLPYVLQPISGNWNNKSHKLYIKIVNCTFVRQPHLFP